MAYSCGYWTADATRRTRSADAQRDKLDLVCRKLGLRARRMRLLDVGCGWGSLSLHAAEHYGVRGHRRHHRRRAARLHRRDGSASAGSRTGSTSGCRTTATWPTGRTTRSPRRDGRARRRGQLPDVRRPACTACCGPAGGLLVQQMSRAGRTRPAAGRSSSPSSRPTCTCGPSARPSRSSRRPGSRCATCTRCASTTCAPSLAWLRTPSSARWDEVVALVGEEIARVWRLYLVGGALAFGERPDGRRPDPRRHAHGTGRRRAARPTVAWDVRGA